MKITVLGAGAIGTAVAHDLCRQEGVSRVQVCEARPVVLRALRQREAHPRLRTYQADARDTHALAPIVSGSAAVVSCVGPEHSPRLARLALDAGAHFVDLGGPLNDPDLAETAATRGRWIVTGAGLGPGLVNVMVMHALESIAPPSAVRVLVGDVPAERPDALGHRLAHSAEKLLDDYTCPVTVVRGGRMETRDPMTGLETVEIDGFGTMEAFYAGGGLGSLATRLADRLDRMDVKILRYPGHAEQMRFLLDLGLADPTVLDVRTHLTYRDVLVRRLRQRLGGAYADAVIVRVDARGEDGGTASHHLVDRFDESTGLTAMQRCTAFPAAIAAYALASGAAPAGGGHDTLEGILSPRYVLDAMAERGIVTESSAAPEAIAA